MSRAEHLEAKDAHHGPREGQQSLLRTGCFGSAIAYSPLSDTCTQCTLRQNCARVAFAKEPKLLAALESRETGNNKAADRAFQIEDVDFARTDLVKGFFRYRRQLHSGKKPRALRDLDNIRAANIDLALIRQGQNPFNEAEDQYEFMRLAVDFLHAVQPGGVTHGDILDLFRQKLSDKMPNTHKGYATKVIKILTAGGVLQKQGTVYCLV